MGEYHVHTDACMEQIRRLQALRDPQVRRAFAGQIARTRTQSTHERNHEHPVDSNERATPYRAGDGLERPAVRQTCPVDRDLDPVLVVPGEILVPAAEAERAIELLDEQWLRDDSADTRERRLFREALVRLVPVEGGELNETDAILRLAKRDVQAGANHVAMLSGRDKAGCTPEPTDVDLGAGETSNDGALVVVIDTGIDQDADDRHDGWLNGVAPDEPDDFDLLDRVDAQGTLIADGLLDLGAGHGTFVAGIVRQLSPCADVRVIRALNTDGVGTEVMIAEAILRAGELFRREGRDRGVVNLSLGMETVNRQEPVGLRLALDALPPEVLVVAAAGNARSGIPLWPAASKRVLAVSSHRGDEARTPSTWANLGSWVDFSTVGECVVSTFVRGTETGQTSRFDLLRDPEPDTFEGESPVAIWTGTSFAAPQVAACLANLLHQQPDLTRARAQAVLQRPDVSLFSAGYGYRIGPLLRHQHGEMPPVLAHDC